MLVAVARLISLAVQLSVDPNKSCMQPLSTCIWPNVTLRIEDRQTVFREEFKGPVRIERRRMAGVTRMVAVNQSNGGVTVLPSVSVVDEASTPGAEPHAAEGSEDTDGPGG